MTDSKVCVTIVVVRISQCMSNDDCVNGGSCETESMNEPNYCTNCNPGFTGSLCDCKRQPFSCLCGRNHFQNSYHTI